MTKSATLRNKLIRLAHSDSELRPHLLPLLDKKAATEAKPTAYLSKKKKAVFLHYPDADKKTATKLAESVADMLTTGKLIFSVTGPTNQGPAKDGVTIGMTISGDMKDAEARLKSARQALKKVVMAAKAPIVFEVGDIVRWTTKFLRNTGQYTGAPRNGKVTKVTQGGYFNNYPEVLWNTHDEPTLVNPANLEYDPRVRRKG